jgi:hypothetical protein
MNKCLNELFMSSNELWIGNEWIKMNGVRMSKMSCEIIH